MENVAQVIIVILFVALLVFSIVIFIFYHHRRLRKHFQEKQLFESESRQVLLEAQLEIQEQTLKNISQEIHDNIGQALSLAKLNLNTMNTSDPGQLNQKIANSKELVSKAISDLRDLSHTLNTDYVSGMGLLKAVEYELDMIGKSANIKTSLEVTGNPSRTDTQKELILFRIIQEGLNNIIRHAEASLIRVCISYNPSALLLTVADNGKGIIPDIINRRDGMGGLGISNMKGRAGLIGADLKISSAEGSGTLISIALPSAGGENEA